MNDNETVNQTQNQAAKRQTAPTVPQQGIQISPELQQQINILNARINNANFAHADLLKEMDNTFKAMATTILVLQKENADLRVKLKEAPSTQ
jgi:hypothetical protein